MQYLKSIYGELSARGVFYPNQSFQQFAQSMPYGSYGLDHGNSEGTGPEMVGGGPLMNNTPLPRRNKTLDSIVTNWGIKCIKYPGDKQINVESFLAKIKNGEEVCYLKDSEMLTAMPFLLEDLPAEWFCMNRLAWPTWEGFKAAFHAQFGKSIIKGNWMNK